MVRYTLNINGQPREVDVASRTTLLSVLRDDLALTGTRYGCGRGQCGACYVIADGRAVAACLMTVEQAATHALTTVEGLADGDTLHPVQAAFIAEDAMQCGYCTTGMLISAVTLLSTDPDPDETTIRETLAKHLCRCGVYGRAVRAVQRAAADGGDPGAAG